MAMSASNRQALITKTQKVLRKHYESVAPPADRSVLEHLLYACCLENAKQDTVDEVFAKLEQSFFDWNEVRVTTVAELSEVMSILPDRADAARRLKRTLQSVFETHYSFDLEFLKKQNLGKSVSELEKFQGVTPFVLAYVTQNALGGHSIAVNQGTFELLVVLGVISEAEAAKQRVPGMERAIPKSKGVEFGSILHQFGVDYAATPFSPRIRAVILEIAPDAKDRLPKRGAKKGVEASDGDTNGAKPKPKKSAKAGGRKKRGDTPRASKSAKSSRSATTKGKAAAADSASDKGKAKLTTKRLSRKKPR
jgi:endonuclease-3